jgi:hypothetical protein
LAQVREARPEVEIEIVEVLSQPGRTLQSGIWMIPALVIGDVRFLRIPPLNDVFQALDNADKGPPIG